MNNREIIEFADELGDRFPDLNDREVIEACEEYSMQIIEEDEILHGTLLDAYISNAGIAIRNAKKVWGVNYA